MYHKKQYFPQNLSNQRGLSHGLKAQYLLVEVIQSMEAGGTGTEAMVAHLCLGHSQNFAQYFHKFKSILGRAGEFVFKNMEKALDEENDLSTNNETSITIFFP